jgi:hypothetical protein
VKFNYCFRLKTKLLPNDLKIDSIKQQLKSLYQMNNLKSLEINRTYISDSCQENEEMVNIDLVFEGDRTSNQVEIIKILSRDNIDYILWDVEFCKK